MSGRQPPERLACLIVARQLGDAAIQAGFLRALIVRGYAEKYLVWTRPHFAFLFADLPECSVVCSQFPVGTTKHFNVREALGLIRAARQVRRHRPSVTLDLLGDFRERLFARLAGSPRHLFIGWSPNHPFAGLIRNPLGAGTPLVWVPPTVPNIYAAYERMLNALTETTDERIASVPRVALPGPVGRAGRMVVGLHPFASQRCKLWPEENWRQLVRELLDRGAEVVVFAAPSERTSLESLLGEYRTRVTLFTESLTRFAAKVRELDVLIGLDSFSVHMAFLQGVRAVTINGGNPPDLWAPPMGISLAESGGCPSWPCFNVPVCEGAPNRYVCVRSIKVQQVLAAVADMGVIG